MNDYEKSVFLTKAQDEIVKNHFIPASRGNTVQQGFDDMAKRQSDFASVLRTVNCKRANAGTKINPNSLLYYLPIDALIVVNESITTTKGNLLQVIPVRYDEYLRLMSKPYKRPLKNQAWRLITSGANDEEISLSGEKLIEVVIGAGQSINSYRMRYVKKLSPIILSDLTEEELSINGVSTASDCELDPILHEEVLQRAVELAKAAWVASNSGENLQLVTQLGQRSE